VNSRGLCNKLVDVVAMLLACGSAQTAVHNSINTAPQADAKELFMAVG
jgi:hypothetical protein